MCRCLSIACGRSVWSILRTRHYCSTTVYLSSVDSNATTNGTNHVVREANDNPPSTGRISSWRTISSGAFHVLHTTSFRSFSQDPGLHLQVLNHHLSKTDLKEKSRTNQQNLGYINDLGVLDEIIMSIRYHRGYNPEIVPKLANNRPQYMKDFLAIIKSWKVSKVSVPCAPMLQNLCTKHQWPKGRQD